MLSLGCVSFFVGDRLGMRFDSVLGWESRCINGRRLWDVLLRVILYCCLIVLIVVVGDDIEDVILIDDVDSVGVGILYSSRILDLEEWWRRVRL